MLKRTSAIVTQKAFKIARTTPSATLRPVMPRCTLGFIEGVYPVAPAEPRRDLRCKFGMNALEVLPRSHWTGEKFPLASRSGVFGEGERLERHFG